MIDDSAKTESSTLDADEAEALASLLLDSDQFFSAPAVDVRADASELADDQAQVAHRTDTDERPDLGGAVVDVREVSVEGRVNGTVNGSATGTQSGANNGTATPTDGNTDTDTEDDVAQLTPAGTSLFGPLIDLRAGEDETADGVFNDAYLDQLAPPQKPDGLGSAGKSPVIGVFSSSESAEVLDGETSASALARSGPLFADIAQPPPPTVRTGSLFDVPTDRDATPDAAPVVPDRAVEFVPASEPNSDDDRRRLILIGLALLLAILLLGTLLFVTGRNNGGTIDVVPTTEVTTADDAVTTEQPATSTPTTSAPQTTIRQTTASTTASSVSTEASTTVAQPTTAAPARPVTTKRPPQTTAAPPTTPAPTTAPVPEVTFSPPTWTTPAPSGSPEQ